MLTRDKNLRYRELELRTLEEVRAKVFALGSGNRKGSEMAEIFVKHLDEMSHMAAETEGPLVVSVTLAEIKRFLPPPMGDRRSA